MTSQRYLTLLFSYNASLQVKRRAASQLFSKSAFLIDAFHCIFIESHERFCKKNHERSSEYSHIDLGDILFIFFFRKSLKVCSCSRLTFSRFDF